MNRGHRIRLAGVVNARAVIVVEGLSDKIAVQTLANDGAGIWRPRVRRRPLAASSGSRHSEGVPSMSS